MHASKKFLTGDRVRISARHWDQDLAGRIGIVAQAPAGVDLQEGCLWIELEVTQWVPGAVDGAEIALDELERE